MKKTGFTLVELLVVIVILALILAIAIPAVTNILNDVKIKAFNNNSKMIIKATRNYLVAGAVSYPVNIGDTLEIKLSDLQAGNYVGVVKSPSNNAIECDGYVVVTKIGTTDYDFTPHLDCTNSIGSISEDGLLGHWKFDDFQEPTENIFPRSSQVLAFNNAFDGVNYNFGAITNIQQVIDNSLKLDSQSAVTKVSRINGGVSQKDYVHVGLSSPLNTTRIASFWYYGTYGTVIRPYNNDLSANLYYLDANGNWVGGDAGIDIPVPVNQWYKITIKIVNKGTISGTGWTWTILHNNAPTAVLDTNQYWAFAMFQYEQKTYATPYVSASRAGIIKDYSSKGQTTNLSTSMTPQWISSGKNSNGSYQFNGSNAIDFTKIDTYNVRSNSEFNTDYTGYSFESRWTPSWVSGGVLRLTYGAAGWPGSFGGGGANLLDGRVYKVTMRVRNQGDSGTQNFGIFNPSSQGNWPLVTVNKSTCWHEVSFYMTGNSSYGGWINSNSGISDGEYYEVDWIHYDLVSNATSNLHTSNVTVMAWIKTSNTGLQSIVSMPYDATSSWTVPYGYGLATQNNTALFRLNIGGIDRSFSAGTIQNNTWHHVALTHNGNTRTGYIDGKAVATLNDYSGNISYSGAPTLVIGQKSDSFRGDYFNGQIDDVRIYNRALTADEVQQIYQTE